jgi:hypothetical protein
MEEAQTTLIPQTGTRYLNNKWRNTKDGKNGGHFEFGAVWKNKHLCSDLKLYFHEYPYWTMDNGEECQMDSYSIFEWEENKQNHIIATGFIVFYLWWIQSSYKDKPVVDLFDTYFIGLRNIYIAEKKTHLEFIETTDDEFNRMFYTQHIEDEKQRIENSGKLFEYLMPQDKQEIQRYIDAYFKHIQATQQDEQELTDYKKETPPTTQQPEVSYPLTHEVERVIKEHILPIWKNNVLANTTEAAFINAITTANFSAYYTIGQTQKVGYFIYSLKQIMGDDWANDAISKLNDDKATLRKFQQHGTISTLKSAMKGIVVVNSAGNRYKIDTKTQYIDRTTNKSYYKATK